MPRTRSKCVHGKRKDNCSLCNACPHGKRKGNCSVCNPCPHGANKRNCSLCNPCPHGAHKRNCLRCKSHVSDQELEALGLDGMHFDICVDKFLCQHGCGWDSAHRNARTIHERWCSHERFRATVQCPTCAWRGRSLKHHQRYCKMRAGSAVVDAGSGVADDISDSDFIDL